MRPGTLTGCSALQDAGTLQNRQNLEANHGILSTFAQQVTNIEVVNILGFLFKPTTFATILVSFP
jgi:hypothetical protein